MFEVDIKIKVQPISDTPYQVRVKVNIEDQGFQEKLLTHSMNHNIRIDFKIKSSFIKILVGKNVSIQILEDRKKDSNKGYLEDYILNGYVYGFEKEDEAEEFESEATNLLFGFIESLRVEYLKSTQSKYFDK